MERALYVTLIIIAFDLSVSQPNIPRGALPSGPLILYVLRKIAGTILSTIFGELNIH